MTWNLNETRMHGSTTERVMAPKENSHERPPAEDGERPGEPDGSMLFSWGESGMSGEEEEGQQMPAQAWHALGMLPEHDWRHIARLMRRGVQEV